MEKPNGKLLFYGDEVPLAFPALYSDFLPLLREILGLDENFLSQSEVDSGLYNDLTKLTYWQRPRYIIYIDDASMTIRVTHIVPQYTDENKTKLQESKYKINFPFYWGTQNKNIVTGWQPEVSTMLYLIRRARVQRANEILDGNLDDFMQQIPESGGEQNADERKKAIEKQLSKPISNSKYKSMIVGNKKVKDFSMNYKK